jgi:lipopolysaccharide transport system ATP-binding protein
VADDIVIRAEGLGKQYMIGQQRRELYGSFRDTLAQGARRAAQGALDLARGRGWPAAAQREAFWALQDVSFQVRRGEVLGVIGRNGAGKSTLLKILSRVTEPSEGRVTIEGRVASLLEVGTGFHPELTGRENVFLNGAVLGMSHAEIRRKFDEIVDFAGVERFLDTPVKRYSSGMIVRLAFSVAAHLEPEILVVDEVLAVGDAEFQKKCLGKMTEVTSREGRTVLFVSHQLGAVARLCERAMCLSHGRLVFSGAVAEAVGRYLDETMAASASAQPPLADHRTAAIVGARLVNADGAQVTRIAPDEALCVRVTARIRRFSPRMLLGIAVDSRLGGRITSHVTRLADHFADFSDDVTLELEIPAGLIAPGEFALSLALWEHGEIYHQLEGEVAFSVMDAGAEVPRFLVDAGLTTLPARWRALERQGATGVGDPCL